MVSLLLMTCLVLAAPAAASADNFDIKFDQKSVQYMAPEGKGNIIVHAGEDRPSANYTWAASASTGTLTPITGSSSAENFTLAYTAASTTGDVTLTVTLSNANKTINSTARYTIHVVKPVTLKAEVKNNGNVSLTNVPVWFKVDSKVVNYTTFSIGANATKTLYYNWTSAALSQGTHTVEIDIDPNSTFVTFADGSRVFTSTFYVEQSPWGLVNILLTVSVVVLLLILVFTYMNKGKKKKRT
jgi:hypothetical protein